MKKFFTTLSFLTVFCLFFVLPTAFAATQREEFLRGVLSAKQTFPTIRDSYNTGGVGFISCASFANENSILNLVLVVSLPGEASDFHLHEVPLLMDKIASLDFDGTHLVIKGEATNIEAKSSNTQFISVVRKIQIKEKANDQKYLKTLKLEK